MSGLFSEKVNVEGWWFYIVVPGTNIYRGSALEYVGEKGLSELEYFSDRHTAEIYGPVTRYQVSEKLLLLAMDDVSNLEQLFDEAPPKVQRAITASFGYKTNKPRVKRDSDYDMDMEVARYVCSMGLAGYAHEAIPSDTAKDFHPETALCDPETKIRLAERVAYPVDQLDEAVRQNRLYVYAREEKKARKRPKVQMSPPERPKRGLINFDDADDDAPPKPPGKRLFE